MAKYRITGPDGATYDITAPDGASEQDVLAYAQTNAKSTPSEATTRGRGLGSDVQGLHNAMNGALMGFGDEVYGGLSAAGQTLRNLLPRALDDIGLPGRNDKNFAQNYQASRDEARGAADQFKTERPVFATATNLAASALPMALAPGGAAPATTSKVMGPLAQALTAGRTGMGFGAVTGAGESTADDLAGVLADTGKSAVISGGLSVAGQGAVNALGAVGKNVAQRVATTPAYDEAKIRIAELLAKDAPKVGAPASRVAARMETLGPQAKVVDATAAGSNTRQTLDTLATLPGEAKAAVEKEIRNLQIGRSGRIVDAADNALGTQGAGYKTSLDALEAIQKKAQAPFRKQLEGLSVRADDELMSILNREPKAFEAAVTLARKNGELPIDLSKLKAGDDLPFDSLDTIKKALWTIAEKEKVNFAPTAESKATNGIRVALTEKMDRLSPKDAKGSIYKQARDAFAGPEGLRDAVAAGRTAMKEDALGVAELTKGMGKAELDAFRVGALQAIKDKVGTEGGQTSMLKFWKEPGTGDKLKEIFGGDRRTFIAALLKESQLKMFEQTGRGSQTAARLMGAGELDAAEALGTMASAAASHGVGAIPAAVGAVNKAWNQVKTPEAVRDEMARLLMLKGPAAQQELQNLPNFMAQVNANRSKWASVLGAGTGQVPKN